MGSFASLLMGRLGFSFGPEFLIIFLASFQFLQSGARTQSLEKPKVTSLAADLVPE